MKKAIIFDLDGTLINSYGKIVKVLQILCTKHHLHMDEQKIYNYVMTYSVADFLNAYFDDYDLVLSEYHSIGERYDYEYQLMPNIYDTLNELAKRDIGLFVYTHSSNKCLKILADLKVVDLFKEIVTSDYNFKRKPDSEAIDYLVNKYQITDAYYVGDRNIDIQAANNANIKGILYLPYDSVVVPCGKEDYVVDDIGKILNIV